MAAGSITVDIYGKPVDVKVEIVFSADMKFMREYLGMKSCKADHPCIFCNQERPAPKAIEINADHYCKPEWLRSKTVTAMDHNFHEPVATQHFCAHWTGMEADAQKKAFDQQYEPLLAFDPQTQIILDEMHMLCRVVENLLKKLAAEAARKDNVEKSKTGKSNLDRLKDMVRQHHPKFDIFAKTADGYSKWTILNTVGGNLRKILNSDFPEKLAIADFLNDDGRADISLLWKQTQKLFAVVSADQPTTEQIEGYGDDALEWLAIFNRLSSYKKDPRYQSKDLSPYQHCLLFHVQHLLRLHGRLKVYNAEGVEKLNSTLKEALKLTNPANRMEDTLKRHHLAILAEPFKRIPRKYEKKDEHYWTGLCGGPSGIQIARQLQVTGALSKKSLGTLPIPDPNEMSTAKIRLFLNKFAGSKTNATGRKKFMEEFAKNFGERKE